MSDPQIAPLPARLRGYDGATVALHWIGAAVVVAAWALGMSMDVFPRGEARGAAMGVHSSLGLLVLTLSALRLLWAGFAPRPAAEGPAWLVPLARLAHAALYAITIAMPVTGLLARWARSGTATLVGGVTLPAPFPLPATKLWAEAHATLATALAVLVVAHVVAALVHHLVLRDGVLRRMLPTL